VNTPLIFIKVDCDTYVGTREGVPRLLEILGRRGIHATFFFTFGPDRSGVAIRRVFTQPGFLAKMLRSRAGSVYGWRTALSGTLLPAPRIGERCAGEMRAVAAAGHETGVHAWDHVAWHDRLDRMTDAEVAQECERAHAAYAGTFGAPARSAAAAGWTVDDRLLADGERRGLLYTSHTRGGEPFFPLAGGRVVPVLEIPTTLPTLDETLSWRELTTDAAQRVFFRGATLREGVTVHTIHAEVEGRSRALLFEAILDDWLAAGARFAPLSSLAESRLARRAELPVRTIGRARLPGRGGTVATGWADAAGAFGAAAVTPAG
jgi:peptidoglycan/xylan/chitin deacetylase (PgdA/CDA1 family)